MHLIGVILKVWVINGQYVIDVSIFEVALRCLQSCLQAMEGQRRSEFHLVGLENIETLSTSSV